MAENKGAAPAPVDAPPELAALPQAIFENSPPRPIVPFVEFRLRAETRSFAESVGAEFHDLTGDDHGYFKLMFSLWSQREPFIVIEQDVLPNDQQFSAMMACPEPWCAGVHKLRDDAPEIWSMGLMKFGAQLLGTRYSQLYTGEVEADGAQMFASVLGANKHFNRVDLAIYQVLALRGFDKPHLHGPAARHR